MVHKHYYRGEHLTITFGKPICIRHVSYLTTDLYGWSASFESSVKHGTSLFQSVVVNHNDSY